MNMTCHVMPIEAPVEIKKSQQFAGSYVSIEAIVGKRLRAQGNCEQIWSVDREACNALQSALEHEGPRRHVGHSHRHDGAVVYQAA